MNYMIWPELLDEKFNVILDKSIRAKNEGFANMWIFSNKEKHIRLRLWELIDSFLEWTIMIGMELK